VSKRFLIVNVILVGIAAFFAISLIRDLTHVRSLPSFSARARPPVSPPATEEAAESAVAAERLANYNVIAAKHLFNPSRSENVVAATAAPPPPPPPKPLLLGVVVDGAQSRAYLEDAITKRVFSYQIGDTVAGGRLETITDDHVVIVRPDGRMEVMLRDPAKPKPAPPANTATAAPPQVPGSPSAPAPAQPPTVLAPPPPVVSSPGTGGSAIESLGRGGRGGSSGRR
jgi:type II secretion system (T2SS) protein C